MKKQIAKSSAKAQFGLKNLPYPKGWVNTSFLFAMLLLFLYPTITLAQAPKIKFKHINSEAGLSNSTIETIYQDSRGFIWIGTRDGLNRYDGKQMLVFKNDPNDKNSISDSYITCIYEDKNKMLWIGTLNGLDKFDQMTNTFTSYKHNPQNPKSISSNHISSICDIETLDATSLQLWIGTVGGGINVFDKKLESFMAIKSNSFPSNGLVSNDINTIFQDKQQNIWVGTESGVQSFNKTTNTFEQVLLPIPIKTFNEDKNGNLLIGASEGGIILYNPLLKTFKPYVHNSTIQNSISSNLVRSILVTKNGTIWTGTINGGLDLFDTKTGKFYNYQNTPEDPFSISQRTVSALFEDNQGNIWVGTHRGGINLYMPKTEKFALYRQSSSENSLSYNDVKAFCEDKFGKIWIGTDGGGLNLFDPLKNTFKHYKYNALNPNTIGSNEVLDITEDSEGNIWVGTWGGGLCLYNRGSDNFTRYHMSGELSVVSGQKKRTTDNLPLTPQTSFIQKIYEDKQKNLWIATYYGGLNLFDRESKAFNRVLQGKNNSILKGNNIVSLNEDASQNLWIGTDDGGLNCLSKGESQYAPTGIFTHYFDNEEKKPDIRVIFSDSKGRLWVGQKGLYLFDTAKNSFELIALSFEPSQNNSRLTAHSSQLKADFIKGIVEDSAGNLWLSTSQGIIQFNPQTHDVRRYNTADGLQGQEFEANAFLKTKKGEIYFGGVNGFNIFYPNRINTNDYIPPVYITDFEIDGKKSELMKELRNEGMKNEKIDSSFLHSFIPSLFLDYTQSTFSFSFAALNYTASENNQYAYKLENWNKDWIYIGNDNKATFTHVSPGTYTLRIKASNNDGLWNENGCTIHILITPPFWQTWWFLTLAFLSVVSAAGFLILFKRNLELQKMEEQKKEEIHQTQLQFFTNISHEFRTPLTLIMGLSEKFSKPETLHATSLQSIHRNATKLLNLVNELMDFRKSESGALTLKVSEGNMNAFLEEIAEEFGELALQRNMTFNISMQQTQTETWFDVQILEKIITNLVANAFKYTPDGGTISIETFGKWDISKTRFENELAIKNDYKAENYIFISVADTGIGISKESMPRLFERYFRISETHLGSGIGLAFVKSLTLLHKGSIYVYSERHKGTEVIIAIPCSKKDYKSEERRDAMLGVSNNEHYNNNLVGFQNLRGLGEEKNLVGFENLRDLAIPTRRDGSTPLILIVEDNVELLSFLKETLETHYNILEAANGKIGFEMAKETSPDLIISDIMMPVMNGLEFCKFVKSDIDTSHIPFIILTAKDALTSKIEGTEIGADYYFTKPLSIELLLLTLKNIFIQKQKIKERYRLDYQSEAKDLVHSSKDKAFLEEFLHIVESNLTDSEMNIDYLCTQVGMSRTKLYTKIKNITGQSIGDFIRSIRLRKAAYMMSHSDKSLSEIMYSVGIQTQSYFTKAFKNEFGKTPTQFLKDLKK